MTKKHFGELADLIGYYNDKLPEYIYNELVEDLVVFCQRQNPRFDSIKFMEAVKESEIDTECQAIRTAARIKGAKQDDRPAMIQGFVDEAYAAHLANQKAAGLFD